MTDRDDEGQKDLDQGEPFEANLDSSEEFEEALKRAKNETYILRLYVTGITPQSQLAIRNLQRVCKEHLQGRYELEVIDIYQQPELAREAQIVAAPTLIKKLPPPLRRVVGNLSDLQRVLVGLDLRARPALDGTEDKPAGTQPGDKGERDVDR